MNSDEAPLIELQDVFVDREKALLFLEDELKSRKNHIKEIVIRITQAPGTGKTRLLQEFIKKMEREGKAVGIYINSPEIEEWINDSPLSLEGMLWRAVFLPYDKSLLDADVLLPMDAEKLVKKYNLSDYSAYTGFKMVLSKNPSYTSMLLNFCTFSLNSIGRPMIIVFDEIQATIGRMMEQFPNEKGQGLFRKIINLIALLIKKKNVLVILSGTNYKIMHFLGSLGSRLRGKTREYKLSPLPYEAVGEFYNRVFGAPQDPVSEELRNWLIMNSNGVPRTMVWMASELLDHGGLDWVKSVGLNSAISELDEKILEIVENELEDSINDLLQFSNGERVLKWLAYTALFKRQISIDEFEKIFYDNAVSQNLCTVDDLVDKGLVHVVDNSIEIRNVYYHWALQKLLKLDEHILVKFLEDVDDSLIELLSWNVQILGTWFEIMFAISLYELAKSTKVQLNDILDEPINSDYVIDEYEKIVRSIYFKLREEGMSSKVIYSLPEAPGIDIVAVNGEGRKLIVQCKNVDRKVSPREFKKILNKMNVAIKELRITDAAQVVVFLHEPTERVRRIAREKNVGIISGDRVRKVMGEKVMKLFEQSREKRKSETIYVCKV